MSFLLGIFLFFLFILLLIFIFVFVLVFLVFVFLLLALVFFFIFAAAFLLFGIVMLGADVKKMLHLEHIACSCKRDYTLRDSVTFI